MKKRIAVIALLLCVAFVMASMAYTSAKVTSAATLRVVNTNQALLALKAYDGTGNKDGTASIEGGKMVFNFNKGYKETFGLQPGSYYIWSPLFTVTNNTSEKIKVTVKAEGEIAQFLKFGSTYSNGNVTMASTEPNWDGTIEFIIDASADTEVARQSNQQNSGYKPGSVGIWVKVEIDKSYRGDIPKSFDGEITVSAVTLDNTRP